MKKILHSLLQEIENPTHASPEYFAKILQNNFKKLYNLNAQNSSIAHLSVDNLQELLDLSFNSRLVIRKRGSQLLLKNEKEDKILLASLTDMNRALRYLEDYTLELLLKKKPPQKQEYITLQGQGAHFTVATGQKMQSPADFLSGDIILSRGNAFTSAAIARIGVSDSQFSHLSFLYRNPAEDGKLYTIEAHIEIGAVVKPFQVHIDQENARSVVFRFEDGILAHQAAEYMYHKVKKHSEAGKNIEYDFSMQYQDSSKLFCSEVAYDGFFTASGGTLDVPRFKTTFNPGLVRFLNRLGVDATKENIAQLKTFCPSDIEFDPRFTLIAEWKNPTKMGDSRRKDAVLTKMFYWMENHDYRIITPKSIAILSQLIWFLRRVPLIQEFLIKQLPLNMNTGQLELFITLDKVGGALLKEIEKVQATKTLPLSMKEMLILLEVFKDREEHKKGSDFCKWFHANK